MTPRAPARAAERWGTLVVALVASLAAVSQGCGYKLAGGNTFLPERIRVIMVAPFQNRTQRPDIEQRVTEEIARELAKRGRYKVVTQKENADALLEGAIVDFRTSPVQLDEQGRATRLETLVTLEATLHDLASQSVLWSQSGLVFREQYDVQQEVREETIALDQIARGAAEALVTSMFEGF